ncbi:hypothetical protein [Brachybacterium massiliense]|uniref:hypothetical protein n=1 Tax=Brachybacterium massiliense TaxID=1755098 RepID=UPI000B3BB3CA|nr:hypothetical protein [Brachybacterium massiliense]
MTTDPTPLQKRIRREFSIPAEWARRRDGETTMELIERWQKRQDEQIAALIAAEVRKAQGEAWTDCVSEASALGWLHATAALDMLDRNPHEEAP